MLIGTGEPEALSEGAPNMVSLDAEGTTFRDVVFVQSLFEIRSEGMCEMLPPALHPTLPPVAGFSLFEVSDSEWGPFRLVQLRIECRSGLRPRGLLVSAVTDNEAAGKALGDQYGFRVRRGEVELARAYDETRIRVGIAGRDSLCASFRGPTRIGEGDMQFVSSLHPANTPRGFRLVQLDARYAVHRAERAPLDLETFDAAAWGEPRIVPSLCLPAVIGRGDVTFDPLRFVCRSDVMAFEGTEPV
jgi:hypothetical protein